MTVFGILLYLLALGLSAVLWRRTHGSSMEALFDRNAAEHHVMARVAKKHPRGGTWPQYRKWIRKAEKKLGD